MESMMAAWIVDVWIGRNWNSCAFGKRFSDLFVSVYQYGVYWRGCLVRELREALVIVIRRAGYIICSNFMKIMKYNQWLSKQPV